MKDIIGRRIKDERERQKLTQEELIKSAQLTWERQTLGQVENGERELKAQELSAISRALKVEMSSFFSDDVRAATPYVLWRQKPQDHMHREAEFLKLCREYRFVESLNAIELNSFRSLPHRKIDLEKTSQAEVYGLAERVRSELDLGAFPANSLVTMLEEKYGVKFIFKELDGSGSAAACVHEFGSCILVSSSEPVWRQHFSIAHELFHIVTWDDKLFDQAESSLELWNKNEKLADAFAAGLLVPIESLREEVRTLAKDNKMLKAGIVTIARKFGVSLEALLWRMASLKMIDGDTVRQLLKDDTLKTLDHESKHQKRGPEYVSSRFVQLAYLAYEKGEISRAKLAKILDQSVSTLSGFLRSFGLQEVSNDEIQLSSP